MSTKLNETPAYELAGLITDLMSKIRKGVISIQEFKKFLTIKRGERRKVFGITIEHPKMKLQNSSVVTDELKEEFHPQRDFNENKTVKYWKSDNFQKYVLNSAKTTSNLPEMNFPKHQFTETIYDKEIMEHFQISESSGLMTREEILWTIASLTRKQPKGEAGTLLNNGYLTIIGYILCDDGVVRAVNVSWFSDVAKWNCSCHDLGLWNAGSEVLSRNL